jgi:hypothetical protein
VPKHCPRARPTYRLYPGRKTDGRDVLGRAAPGPAGAICSSGVAEPGVGGIARLDPPIAAEGDVVRC